MVSSTGSVSCSTTVVTDKRSSNNVASHYHQLHIILTNVHRNLPFDRTVIRVCHTEVNSSICIEWLGNVYTFYCKKIIYIYIYIYIYSLYNLTEVDIGVHRIKGL